MPQQPGKQPVNSKPSPGLLQRLLGGQMSESTQEDWPELAKEWASAQINMPNEASRVSRVTPMGPVERMITGGASGRANLGRISLNRQAVTEDNNLKEVLQHELAHMTQPSRGFKSYFKNMVTPWGQRPEEQEAMAAELKFPRVQRDIYLPSEYDKKDDFKPRPALNKDSYFFPRSKGPTWR